MAASGGARGKRPLRQEDLRRLMRERRQADTRQVRVESPHARYLDNTGALCCTLCNTTLKSTKLWTAHALGRTHREKLAELKNREQNPNPEPSPKLNQNQGPSAPKRKAVQTEHAQEEKRSRGSSGSTTTTTTTAASSAGLGLLAGNYGGDDDDDDDEEEEDKGQKHKAEDSASGLPADFFDSGVPNTVAASHSGSVSKADDGENLAEKKEKLAEALPEGFFDDPVRDAKVRNVDTPKDHMDKEWEEFQKELRQVSNASEAIVAEEDEEGRIGRQIHEIDEQMECLRRVEALRSKQEAVKGSVRKMREEEEQRRSGSEDEDDEEELMHVLGRDWRAKGALV